MTEKQFANFTFQAPFIKSVPEVSSKHIKEREHTFSQNILNRLTNSINEDAKETAQNHKETIYFNHFKSYIHRMCSNKSCHLTSNMEICTKCILDNYNISHIRLDKTLIYFHENDFLCTQTDIEMLALKFQKFHTANTFPPTSDELFAIFYYHKKFIFEKPFKSQLSFLSKKDSIYPFVSLAAEKIIHSIPETKRIIAQDGNYDRFHLKILSEMSLPLPSQDEAIFSKNRIQYELKKDTTVFNKKGLNLFDNLRSILFNISNGNTHTINQLFTLLGKIYIGKSIFKILNQNYPQITVIQCNNISYIRKFLYCLCPPEPHTTEYPLNSLSYKLLPIFIKNKYFLQMLNLDSSNSTCLDPSFIKKLVSDHYVSIKDPVFGEISHKNNMHYIYITDKNESNIEKSLGIANTFYNIIHFDGDLSNSCSDKFKLNPHEHIFMLLTSIFYTIDTYIETNTPTSPITLTSNNDSSIEKNISTFLLEFCTDSTMQISSSKLIDMENIQSFDEKSKSKKISELGIDCLPFSTRNDLFQAFDLWYNATFSKKHLLSIDDFTKILKDRYHPIFYKKRQTIGIYVTEKREYRGFYGLSIQKDKLDSHIEKCIQVNAAKLENKLTEDFSEYLSSLIRKYMI
ncbi:hypothetical protein SAMN05660742_12928 [Propionispira arboris]|uniref:Uncharacterized protein n=1 Tax=Propionispira arboris TaxID=84035 RepID=A0A1H7D5N0_9FIRM|nr:hypothetical protein [Propionispira arboris]SEJ96107.1 hypothetical protein SAMN05660742_12928 [Propionispira arboris]